MPSWCHRHVWILCGWQQIWLTLCCTTRWAQTHRLYLQPAPLGSLRGADRAWASASLHHRNHCAGCWPATFKYFGRILFYTGRNAFNSLHFSWRPALGMQLPDTHAQGWLGSAIWRGCALWLWHVSRTDLKRCWRNDRRSMQTFQDQRPDSDFSCMKAAATLLKAVMLLFPDVCEEIVHYSLSEPKHIRAFMLLWYLVRGVVNLLRRHLPAAGSFYAGEFILSRILAAANDKCIVALQSVVLGKGGGFYTPPVRFLGLLKRYLVVFKVICS